jgi:phosphoenolpyruvate synthase/pyruvate phosphate dikinase
MVDVIIDLATLEARDAPVEEVGGKGHGLAALFALGFPVPPAVVVPVSADGLLDVAPVEIVQMLGEGPLAVRSSAVAEDTDEHSAAGQYESRMGVAADGLLEAIGQVRRSADSARARAYAGAASAIAVVIQREIPASRAGVAFSRDPLGASDEVVIECIFGHGEALVSGTVTPDRYRVTSDGAVTARLAATRGPRRSIRTLRDDEVQRIAEMTHRVEDGFGVPVDVEFCFERRTLWLLQARAITTLERSR